MLFRNLIEAKQVGVIYHFTTNQSFKKMIDSKFREQYSLEEFEMYAKNDRLSCTRNYCLAEDPLGDISKTFGYNVRINIDGTKLSNKYKIKPVLGFTNNKDVFDIKNKDEERFKRSQSENEELVFSKKYKTYKIKDYIISITISGDSDFYKQVVSDVEKMGIKIEYSRKFRPINEDIDFNNEISMYDII